MYKIIVYKVFGSIDLQIEIQAVPFKDISKAEPDEEGVQMLRIAMERLSLSARAYNRILKVARTIAGLEGSENVKVEHLAEAISYRNLDRRDWAER